MRKLSIIALILSCIVPALPGAWAREGRFTLVLFGASWCGPCIGEVRALPQIAEAAQGDAVIVAWVDGNLKDLRPVRPDNVSFASSEVARALWGVHGQMAAGLPFSVMLDASGHRCAHWARVVTPVAMAAMRRACMTGG